MAWQLQMKTRTWSFAAALHHMAFSNEKDVPATSYNHVTMTLDLVAESEWKLLHV